MLRPRLFLDTQVCGDAASGVIAKEAWELVSKYIGRHFRYCISPLTAYELLNRFKGDTAHFQAHQASLHILYRPYKKTFLRLPGQMLRVDSYGLPPLKLEFEPQKLELFIQVALAARTKEDLTAPNVQLSKPSYWNKFCGLDVKEIEKQLGHGKTLHLEELSKLRDPKPNHAHAPSTRRWAASVLRNIQKPSVTSAECDHLGIQLDGAFRYFKWLCHHAEKTGYKIENDLSSWIDYQQLFYLCDETMHFVTNDSDFRIRAAGSPHLRRVWDSSYLHHLALKQRTP